MRIEIINNPKIKDLPKIERPREKLIQYGPERLSNFFLDETRQKIEEIILRQERMI